MNMMARSFPISLLALTLAFPSAALAGGSAMLVATKKVVIKDNGEPADFKVKVVVKDPAVDPSLMNPPAVGNQFYFYSSDRADFSDPVNLFASSWTAKGSGFRYKDDTIGKIRAKILPGKFVFKSTGAPFNYAVLNAMQSGTILYRLLSGLDSICGYVPGADGTVKKDSPEKGIYIAGKSEAPVGCPAQED